MFWLIRDVCHGGRERDPAHAPHIFTLATWFLLLWFFFFFHVMFCGGFCLFVCVGGSLVTPFLAFSISLSLVKFSSFKIWLRSCDAFGSFLDVPIFPSTIPRLFVLTVSRACRVCHGSPQPDRLPWDHYTYRFWFLHSQNNVWHKIHVK